MIEPVLRCAPHRLSRGCLALGWAALLTLVNAHAQITDTTAQTATIVPALPAATGDAQPVLPNSPPMGHSASGASATPPTPADTAPPSNAWQRLSKRQKQALNPLASSWDTLTPGQQQNWLTLSRGFLQLTDEEQITLHARMSDWAALSPKQRSQARFHFNTTQKLPINDKRAQWEAYQQLSEQDKRQLSSGPRAPVKSAARSTKPPSPRLITPPAMPVSGERAIQRIAATPVIDTKTLLPLTQRAPRGARQ